MVCNREYRQLSAALQSALIANECRYTAEREGESMQTTLLTCNLLIESLLYLAHVRSASLCGQVVCKRSEIAGRCEIISN